MARCLQFQNLEHVKNYVLPLDTTRLVKLLDLRIVAALKEHS